MQQVEKGSALFSSETSPESFFVLVRFQCHLRSSDAGSGVFLAAQDGEALAGNARCLNDQCARLTARWQIGWVVGYA